MSYQIYKQKLDIDKYFSNWDSSQYNALNDVIKNRIYSKYLVKCDVLTRDNFTCQHENCTFCKNESHSTKLTMHHIKFQKNGGKDSVKNGITLCLSIHKGFHRAKHELKFPNADYLPSNIRGHTFKLEKSDEVNWKTIKAEMKKMRKNFKNECGIRISLEQLNILLKFLELDFNSDDD